MSTRPKFRFPLATLTHSAGLLGGALADAAYTAAMDARLDAGFAAAFDARVAAVTGKATAQSGQTGDISGLTGERREKFEEMERLTAGARRSAKLAFPGQDTVLRAEFQVGVADSKSLEAELGHATKTHAATLKYATELKAKGWIAADSTLLGTTIEALGGKDIEKEEAVDDRLGLTNEKVIAANALYHDCLTIQNAARLQYPGGKDAAGNARNVTERARFLLDEFPPRDRSEPDGGTQGETTPPPAP